MGRGLGSPGWAKLWDYTPSHSTLTVRIESQELGGNLHICCGGCESVRGPIAWTPCHLDVTDEQDEDGDLLEVLRDKGTTFELRCQYISAVEHVEPVYFLDRLTRLNPDWLAPRVMTLAEAIRQGGSFSRLPELAQALEEAGCCDEVILAHCRYPLEHHRECWVIELLLGKG